MASTASLVDAPRTWSDTIVPQAPPTLEDTGLADDDVSGLLLKILYAGEAAGRDLADRVCLPYGMIEPVVEHLRAEHLMEVRSAVGAGTAGYRYSLTDMGRDRTRALMTVCGYVGAAPVPLTQYLEYMKHVRAATGHVDRDRIVAGFSDLIVTDDMIDQLGPAVSSRKAMFLHGPPGNGKSVMGRGIGRALGGDVYVPHALDIDGQVISLFDPVSHVALEQDDASRLIRTTEESDRRWVRIRRPVITVGGELTLDMLDLNFNQLSSFYEAPMQLKANGGVLVIDDFGRQRVPARELLNRWIVPLEARVDYLTLTTGRKFEVPFDVLVVFATNLEPRALADEAFLRRIPYKILAQDPSYEQYTAIFKLNCERSRVAFDRAAVDYLYRHYYNTRGIPVRACHPRDLIDQIVNRCHYNNRTPAITEELLDAACRVYFLDAPVTPKTEASM